MRLIEYVMRYVGRKNKMKLEVLKSVVSYQRLCGLQGFIIFTGKPERIGRK